MTLFVAAFILRLAFIHFLTGALDGDSSGYMNLAHNLLREHVYSIQNAPPFTPTFTRVPGYPLFIALTYVLGGLDNITAVRIAQALIDAMSCVGVAVLATVWENEAQKKHTASLAAFALAAICPFTIRYVPTILAETLSTFLAVVLVLSASYAFLAPKLKRALAGWALTGILGGLGTLVRPDGVLFILATVTTLIVVALWVRFGKNKHTPLKTMPSLSHAWLCTAVALLAFTFMFAPWPIRNEVVFHRFILLQPKHQGLPNGFVPSGYYDWLRTWVDDQRYIKPFRWEVDYSPIVLEQLPAKAFDSPQERARVGQLLAQYNHPQFSHDQPASNAPASVRMTPQIDSGFSQIATERRKRDPFRFYVWLPVKRAVALWFDTHSDHYPFEGEIFSIPGKSYFQDGNHSYPGYVTLWLFAMLVWLYTLLGLSGARQLWRAGQAARICVVFLALIMLSRLAFFSTLDNPEPRFLVQFFPFLSALGGIAIGQLISGIKGERNDRDALIV